jgi:hypothetical protein
MSFSQVSLTAGVVVERISEELLVITPGASEAVKLSGHAAEVFRDIHAGRSVDVSDPVVSELARLGIIGSPGMSRRGLMRAGAIGVGAGIAVLALPSVAAASSGPAADEPADDPAVVPLLGFIYDYVEDVTDTSGNLYVPRLYSELPDDFEDGPDPVQGKLTIAKRSGGTETIDASGFIFFFLPGYLSWEGAATAGLDIDLSKDQNPFVLTFTYKGTPYRVTEGLTLNV